MGFYAKVLLEEEASNFFLLILSFISGPVYSLLITINLSAFALLSVSLWFIIIL
jgi:uncharacterized membrane protein YoaK (UPF0700 family)